MTHPTDSAPTQAPSEEQRKVGRAIAERYGMSAVIQGMGSELAIAYALAAESERTRRECEAIFERDRTIVADAVAKCRKTLASYEWLAEGRGSYSHDDDRWMGEFANAMRDILAAMEPLRKLAADLTNSPMDLASIVDARADWKARAEKAEADLARAQQMLDEADAVIAALESEPDDGTAFDDTPPEVAAQLNSWVDEALARHAARRAKEETKGE